MPELTDCMYAHQQICIPPTFPYLLRQYAKAAIRSQPTDLLKWSTAYFRSLSLGLPPPVKPRLEYPISKTQFGLTPGWLKTLLRQLAGYTTVTWPLLVDRWTGACMDLSGLVEIIMVGKFPDPANIPWYRFVATAAGFLTQNLTSTMILICELLTEEPEGGSAMIPVGTFNDLYKFLARIDASEPKTYRNFFYTESNLALTKREPEAIRSCVYDLLDRSTIGSISTFDGQQMVGFEEATERPSMEMYPIMDYGVMEGDEDGGTQRTEIFAVAQEPALIPEILSIHTSIGLSETSVKKGDSDVMIPPELDDKDSCFIMLEPEQKDDNTPSVKGASSSESSESAEFVASIKSSVLIEEEMEAEEEVMLRLPSHTGDTTSESVPTEPSEEIDIVNVPAIVGIGPIVPEELINAVIEYMKKVSMEQQGMVMPRNIRHYMCPPLEVMKI